MRNLTVTTLPGVFEVVREIRRHRCEGRRLHRNRAARPLAAGFSRAGPHSRQDARCGPRRSAAYPRPLTHLAPPAGRLLRGSAGFS